MKNRPPDRIPSYQSEPVFRPLPQFRVVLDHQPDQQLMHIVRSIMAVTRYGREEATQRMWESHHLGKSLLTVTHLEKAEMLVEQFERRGLKLLLEPAS